MEDQNSDKRINKILGSLDGLQKAPAPDFFYTRLMSRLQHVHTSAWEKITMILSRPTVAFACILMIVIINLFAVFSQNQSVKSAYQSELASNDEYTQVSNSYYDLENTKP